MTLLVTCHRTLTAPTAEPRADAHAALARAVAAAPVPASYESLRARAIVEWRPLVVWVGVRRPDLERSDWLHYHCDSFPGAMGQCVVVGRPANGELWRVADLSASGLSAERLQSAVTPPAAIIF